MSTAAPFIAPAPVSAPNTTGPASQNAPPPPCPRGSSAARAVAASVKAYQEAYSAHAAKGKDVIICLMEGHDAFRLSLPNTDTLIGVNAFVTCVVQGIKMGVLRETETRQLLHAARVALSVHRQRKPKK
jgi:hypothetical protein